MAAEITNSQIAELLCVESESAKHHVQRAMRKAARAAHLWTEEAAEIVAAKRSVTELSGVGPFLEKLILKWIERPPKEIVEPEIRRDFFTWTQAQKILAAQPDWKKDVRGDLQMHTEWSDGTGTVRDMAMAAIERGYQYIAITDHAKKLKIAGGINEEELQTQGEEIQAVNKELAAQKKSFRVLRSIELNLDLSGIGDMESQALEKLDVVLGAFHLSLRKTDDQTARYLGALNNPHLNILGHPRGRIYNFRLGLQADWPRIFETAAQKDKAIEIDSYPDRQDSNLNLLKLARKAGCRISIGTDAHHPPQLQFIDFGLAAALAAKIPKERILNFMSRKELLAWAKRKP
ncbi:MAG TPA: PHP domain-containing protein [Verrucomicrobiae bacterium]|jgi:histidinol phosphatase-like PHP family hydrolase|nr:PHP domain-containing protein [Verrucomicrobiae bacterium]